MKNELRALLENDKSFDFPYDREEDFDQPKQNYTRKKVLKLKDIHKLKKIRNQQREEIAQDSVFIPLLYGPKLNPEGGDMMGGMDNIPM